MMMDYKEILTRHCALGMSGSAIAGELSYSKSGVNDFLRAFRHCDKLSYPLPEGITNYAIAELVYGKPNRGTGIRDESYELPDFPGIHKQMTTRKNMTLVYQWNRYRKRCEADGTRPYGYRQFCERYSIWCRDNYETAHFTPVAAQIMEVDFAGKTFCITDRTTGEIHDVVVFVAILPYSQKIYAEGMLSTREPQWIQVNNNALSYFGGVPALVVCDNCKQAVIANRDWIDPELNKDYKEWADHNHTAIMPAKVRHPKYKGSVENAVGILEKGIFHDLAERQYFSLGSFNADLWRLLDALNQAPFRNREHNRQYYWEEEKEELMPLPPVPYEYTERKEAKVSNDFHVRFDNAYYSVDKAYKHQKVSIRATADKVRIYSHKGELIAEHTRAVTKGQWCTKTEHLPKNYSDYREWNSEYFIRQALIVGPNTADAIRILLKSRKLEVQTYRMCLGVLNYSSKYGKRILEECCRQAVAAGKVSYSYIKNSIIGIAEDLGTPEEQPQANRQRNEGGFIMDPRAMDVGNLLSRSSRLAHDGGKEADA